MRISSILSAYGFHDSNSDHQVQGTRELPWLSCFERHTDPFLLNYTKRRKWNGKSVAGLLANGKEQFGPIGGKYVTQRQGGAEGWERAVVAVEELVTHFGFPILFCDYCVRILLDNKWGNAIL